MIKISGLPAGVTESDLDELFSPYGKITVREITTEENKSIALVELDGNIGAAVDKLDGKPFRGQCILTVEAHPPFQYPDGTVGQSYDGEMNQQLLDKSVNKPVEKPVDNQ
jgi:RNA recognition motif-containing protein